MIFRISVCRGCGLRFPVDAAEAAGVCPVCGAETGAWGAPFAPHAIPRSKRGEGRPVISAVLDNLRSAWNVGSIFRTADSAGVRHLYLCGITPTPENLKVKKTALGAERMVRWSYHPDGMALVRSLAAEGARVWALEGGPESQPIRETPAVDGVTWVIGNENAGVDPGILELCERVFYLPMMGEKESLNVVVAFGVAVYSLM